MIVCLPDGCFHRSRWRPKQKIGATLKIFFISVHLRVKPALVRLTCVSARFFDDLCGDQKPLVSKLSDGYQRVPPSFDCICINQDLVQLK